MKHHMTVVMRGYEFINIFPRIHLFRMSLVLEVSSVILLSLFMTFYIYDVLKRDGHEIPVNAAIIINPIQNINPFTAGPW